jgi:hypothetical protein
MKILITVFASMMISGAVMAACDVKSPQECTSESACKDLEKVNGSKYSFDSSASGVKCTLASIGLSATKCTDANDGGRGGKEGSQDKTSQSAADSSGKGK